MNDLLRNFARTITREKGDTLLLVLTSALILAPFFEYSPGWVNATAALLIGWRVWLTWSGKALPAKWLLGLITTALFAGVYLHFHTWLGKEAGVAFLVVLLCLKMLELNSRRDAVAAVFVCYFLLTAQLLYSQSLLSALYMLMCTGLALSVQLTFQYTQLAPPLSQRIFAGFKILAMAVPLALILFLFFPRLQGPLWGKQQGVTNGVSGLSDSMAPGNVAELALSDQIAFRVRFTNATPRPEQLYWRGIVLDTFDGSKWTVSAPSVQDSQPTDPGMKLATGTQVVQEIILEPHSQRWLFALDQPVYLTSFNATPVGRADQRVSHLTGYGEVRSTDRIQDRTRYTVVSRITDTQPADLLALRQYALQLPTGLNPLTMRWAYQVRSQSDTPTQAVIAVLRYFRNEPFRYTLNPPPLGTNQIDDFLFGTRAGFCEHYASAFVVVMRAMHIPARVVTGYQGGEYNSIDQMTTIRQADAHAWAEVWIDQRGWVRVDPTAAVAPNRIEHGINGSLPDRSLTGLLKFSDQSWAGQLARRLRMQWDATNSAWNLWVLNYNLGKQLDLLSSISGIDHPLASQLGMVMMLGAGAIATVLSLLMLGKKTVVSPLDKTYQRFCRHMQRLGYPRMANEGALDYRARLQPVFAGHTEIAEFLSLYSQCKYGPGYNPDKLTQLTTILHLCLRLKAAHVALPPHSATPL